MTIPPEILEQIEKEAKDFGDLEWGNAEGGETALITAQAFAHGAKWALAQKQTPSQAEYRYSQIDQYVTKMGGWANFKTWVDKNVFNEQPMATGREFWIVSEYGTPPFIEYEPRKIKDGYSIHVKEVLE